MARPKWNSPLARSLVFVLLWITRFTVPDAIQAKVNPGQSAAVLSQYGITWTFDREYPVGQFITGDYWVIGPVTVTSISPAPAGGRNGSMVNPVPGNAQAYDARNTGYAPALLKKPPFVLAPGESLVSTISVTSYPYVDLMGRAIRSGQGCTRSAAILTCVSSRPDPNAFRFPYIGHDKRQYLKSTLHQDRLPRLPIPEAAPNLAALERYFERPWIDHAAGWSSRLMHPADNMPNYGRELVTVVGDAGLALCLDYPEGQKERLLIGLIQVGIDNYHSAVLNKHLWSADGGHMLGRKFPILFAGWMLGDPDMLALNDYDDQEDMATYFGGRTQTLWTGWQNSGHPYAANVLYLLRQGADTAGNPWNHENYNPRNWGLFPFPNNPGSPQYPYDKHEAYRRLVSAAIPGQTIAARILGLKSAWNHDAYFSYVDRWMYENDVPLYDAIRQSWPTFAHIKRGQSCESAFAREMYLTWRPRYN